MQRGKVRLPIRGVLCLLPIFVFSPLASAQSVIFTVTSLVDDAIGIASNCNQTQSGSTPLPNCSLRDAFAAVAALNSSTIVPTINFAGTLATSSGTITPTATSPGLYTLGTGGALVSYNSMNIVGPGANILSISGAKTYQPFVFVAGTISISGLTIREGLGGNGGAIDSYTTLQVANCVISDNSVSNSGGGIENSGGALTVTHSTISANSAGKSGGIDNYGGLTTVIDSTISGNSALDGGGIESSGTLTVTNSTFSNNSATLDDGGAINGFAGTALTVINSTFSGNTAQGMGGAIYVGSKTAIANSILSGNSAPQGKGGGISNPNSQVLTLTNDVISDSIQGSYVDSGGSVIAGISGAGSVIVNLATLANYGGPTATMIPLPDSAAICAGAKSPGNDASGSAIVLPATDQRGVLRMNATYPGYASTTPCVDAGAVQTDYSMRFTTEPPSIVTAASTFAAAVTLNEGANAFAPSVQIPLTLNQVGAPTAQLTGGLAATASGVAAYSLSVNLPASGDSLTATLMLNHLLNLPAGLALTATSSSFDVNLIPAATPIFSVPGGTYTAAQTVAISDTTPNATIYYTTDGTTPAATSAQYTGPINVSSSETLQAVAIASGYATSSVASATYTINLPPPDFAVTATPTSLTVKAGQKGTVTLGITPANGFKAAVSFSCSGLPSGSSCSFSPATVTPSGAAATTTLTISTSASAALNLSPGPLAPMTALYALLCCLGVRRRRLQNLLLLALTLTSLGLLSACGGGNPRGSSNPPVQPVVSTITVTAVSGSLQHTAAVSLTVD